jgi:hypothetical protein
MNATVSFTTSLAHSWAHAAHHMAPRPAHWRRVQILCAALAVLSFAVNGLAASEAEVKVTGCVVDHGGRPYKEVNIALSGVNYKGGAGYTGNHSETRTDHLGEFTVRMKAGVPERPAQASIRGTREIYTTGGWTGSNRSGTFAGADVWPETLVQNIGKPVDLRPKGCIRFPYPITVLGAATSENLYEQDPWPHRSSLRLRLSRGDGHLDMGTPIPVDSRRVQEIDFGVDFRAGDTYSVDIIQQPYSLGPAVPPTQKMCIQCDLVRGATETIGQTPDIIIPVHRYWNLWGVQSLRLQCKRKSIVKPDASCEAGAAQEAESVTTPTDEASIARSREGAQSGAKQFQEAIEQAKQGGDEGGSQEEVCNGQGTKKYPDGSYYTGNWLNCNKHGQGTMKWSDGSQYIGNWVDGNYNGYGTFKGANGDQYTGNWVNNKKQGQGTYTWTNGDQFTGNFDNGAIQGQGTLKEANGKQHTGNFVNNKKQGHGTLTFADGTRFEGEWQDGKQMSGTEISPNGTRVEMVNGEWVKPPQQISVAQAKLEEEKKAQQRKDRLEQEAYKRERQARADKRRQARKKQQEEQEAEEAQNTQEMSEAIGTLLGAFAQMGQNNADRAQAQYDNQQRLAQEQQRIAGSGSPNRERSQSRNYASSKPAIECVSIERNAHGGASFANHCASAVEAFWCIEGVDCKHGTWGMSNSWTIRPGHSYPISGSRGKNVQAFACDKPNASIIEHGPNLFSCKD